MPRQASSRSKTLRLQVAGCENERPPGRRFGLRTKPVHCYRIAGLAVASEIELPGAIPAPHSPAPAVTVRAAAVPAALQDAAKKGATWQIAGERFLFQVPDVARFLLTVGREIL